MNDENLPGLAGQASMSPSTFIISIAEFIPAGYAIIYYGCMLVGLLMMATAVFRQIETAKGRGKTTTTNNLLFAFFGAGLAVISEYIGGFGKGLFGGEFQDGAILFYAAKDDNNLSRLAVAAFLYVVQFFGACGCIMGWNMAARLSGGSSPAQGNDSWWGVFWFWFGGLACVFIQYTIGIFSRLTGFGLSRFINSL